MESSRSFEASPPGANNHLAPKDSFPCPESYSVTGIGKGAHLYPTLRAGSLRPERRSDFLKVTQQNSAQPGPKPRCRYPSHAPAIFSRTWPSTALSS